MPSPTCPAATALAGPPVGGPSVVCGVMAQRRQDSVTDGASRGAHITDAGDPSTLRNFCCGRALPGGDPEKAPRATFEHCPIWREEKDSIQAGLGSRGRFVTRAVPD